MPDTDFEKFKAFFKERGVLFFAYKGAGTTYASTENGHTWLTHGAKISVSQAHFVFDENESFIGTVADEMGYFEERKVGIS